MLDLARVRAIALDLDDTLWPVMPTIARAEARLQAWLRDHAPRTADLLEEAGVRHAIRAEVNRDWAHVAHDFSALRQESIRRALLRAGDDTDLAPAAFEVFFEERQNVTLFDDAMPALRRLSSRYPLVAVSNGNADVHRVGLGEHFRAQVSAREIGVAKPDPRIFHAAAQRLDVSPSDVLHIGDDAHLDVVGALDAGMQAVWINRHGAVWSRGPDHRPHLEAADLAAVCDALAVAPIHPCEPERKPPWL